MQLYKYKNPNDLTIFLPAFLNLKGLRTLFDKPCGPIYMKQVAMAKNYLLHSANFSLLTYLLLEQLYLCCCTLLYHPSLPEGNSRFEY